MLDCFSGLPDQFQAEQADFEQIADFHLDPKGCEAESRKSGKKTQGSAADAGFAGDPRVVTLSAKDAKWFRISRQRQAMLKKVARDRRGDPNFPWRRWAYYEANEKRQFPPGLYTGPGLRGVETWSGAHVLSILYRGKTPVFYDDEDAPPHIIEEVRAGVADAPADEDYSPKTGRDFAKGLGVTAADRQRLEVWLIGATDRTRKQLKADAKERRKQRARDAWRAAHPNCAPREQSYAAVARKIGISVGALKGWIKRLAEGVRKQWEIDGIARSTWYWRKAQAKAAKAKAKAANAQGVVGLAPKATLDKKAVVFLRAEESFPESSGDMASKKNAANESNAASAPYPASAASLFELAASAPPANGQAAVHASGEAAPSQYRGTPIGGAPKTASGPALRQAASFSGTLRGASARVDALDARGALSAPPAPSTVIFRRGEETRIRSPISQHRAEPPACVRPSPALRAKLMASLTGEAWCAAQGGG